MLDLPAEDIGPGVHPNIPEDIYRALPYAHYSGLKDIAVSPAYYQHKLANPIQQTVAMSKGTAVGYLLSEGYAEYRNRYIFPPPDSSAIPTWMELAESWFTGQKADDKRYVAEMLETGVIVCKESDFDAGGLKLGTTAGGLWRARIAADGKIPISDTDDTDVVCCVDAIQSHPLAGPIVKEARHEVAIIWDDEETGVRCKARLDLDCTPSLIADLKTSEDVHQKAFNRAIDRFSYHWQAGMYSDGARTLDMGNDIEWKWIVAEPHAPYHVRVSKAVSLRDLEIGRSEYRAALRLYKVCRDSGVWPSDSGLPVEYGLSRFYGGGR